MANFAILKRSEHKIPDVRIRVGDWDREKYKGRKIPPYEIDIQSRRVHSKVKLRLGSKCDIDAKRIFTLDPASLEEHKNCPPEEDTVECKRANQKAVYQKLDENLQSEFRAGGMLMLLYSGSFDGCLGNVMIKEEGLLWVDVGMDAANASCCEKGHDIFQVLSDACESFPNDYYELEAMRNFTIQDLIDQVEVLKGIVCADDLKGIEGVKEFAEYKTRMFFAEKLVEKLKGIDEIKGEMTISENLGNIREILEGITEEIQRDHYKDIVDIEDYESILEKIHEKNFTNSRVDHNRKVREITDERKSAAAAASLVGSEPSASPSPESTFHTDRLKTGGGQASNGLWLC